MPNSIRLPVQVGTSSLGSVARAAATLVPGALLAVAGALGVGEAPGLALGGLVVGGYLVVYAVLQIRLAWRTRASDALLAETGLALEGGAYDGLATPWAGLDPAETKAETVREARLTLAKIVADLLFVVFSALASSSIERAPADRIPIRRLQLGLRDGRRLRLAEAEHPEEQSSLDALLGSIQGRLGTAAPAPPAERAPEHLGCPTCGAAVPPAEAEAVACRHCHASVSVPVPLRERVAAHRMVAESRRGIAEAVTELLHQPGARRANVTIALVAAFAAFGWLGLAALAALAGLGDVGVFEVGWLVASGLLLTAVLFVLARASLAQRRALHLLATAYGARAPRAVGGAYGCRRCGAPLPETAALVVRCAYCDTESLRGLDLRHEVAPTKAHAESLEQVLERRQRERRGWLGASAGALLLLLVAGVMALASFEMGREIADLRRRCGRGDGAACADLGRKYYVGVGVAKDEAKAADLYARACRLRHAEGCYELSERLRWGWGTTADPRAAAAKRAEACSLGHAEACQPAE